MTLEGKRKMLEKEHELWLKKKTAEFTEWQLEHPTNKDPERVGQRKRSRRKDTQKN